MSALLPWVPTPDAYPQLAKAVANGRQYVVWEQPSRTHPGALTYTTRR
jgi:hypothetical protein